MKKLLFASLIAIGGFAAATGVSSAMSLAPAALSHHAGGAADVQDVRYDEYHHHHYRYHHHMHPYYRHHHWYRPRNFHRGEDRDLHFRHDPHSQWRREHSRYQ